MRALIYLFVMITGSSMAVAQSSPSAPLGEAQFDGTNRIRVVELPNNVTRTFGLRLEADSDVVVSKIRAIYANGRTDFHFMELRLKRGVASITVLPRDDGQVVDTITIEIGGGARAAQRTQIKVLGTLKPGAPNAPATVFRNDESTNRYVEVGVLFGTTRRADTPHIKEGHTIATFSGDMSESLTTGRALVTIPKERELGTIPRPTFSFVMKFRKEDPSKEFTIAEVKPLSGTEFSLELGRQARGAKKFAGQAFVFIHGFNVQFDDALYHTAQIAYDVGFDGPALLFSWPSRGNLLSYLYDRELARSATADLKKFLMSVAALKDINSVHIIAHSMGNEPLVQVLKEQGQISKSGGRTDLSKLGEIIFAAPDVGKDTFSEMAGLIGSFPRSGATLYASNKDLALGFSSQIANPIDRAGYVVPGKPPLIVRDVDTIDMSEASWMFGLNHTTFSERRHLLDDLSLLFKNGKHPPHERFLVFRPMKSDNGVYWKYK